jgi:hypothetical protein
MVLIRLVYRPRIDVMPCHTRARTHTYGKLRSIQSAPRPQLAHPTPTHLDQERELLDAEGAGGGKGVEGEVDGGAASGVPAPAGAAPGEGPALGRGHGGLPAVEELEHEDEHLVADGADGDDELRRRGRAGAGRRRRVVGVEAAEELAEEEAARREHAAVRVHQAALHAERHVAEGLPVDEQVEVVQREGLERVLRAHDLMCRAVRRRPVDAMRCDAREVVKTKDLAPACLFGASGRPGRPDGRPEDGDKKAGFGARGRKASKAAVGGRKRERGRGRG